MTPPCLRWLGVVAAFLLVVAGCGSRVEISGDDLASRVDDSSPVGRDQEATPAEDPVGSAEAGPGEKVSVPSDDAAIADAAAQAAAPVAAPEPEEAAGEPVEQPKAPTGIITSIEPQCVERPGTVVVTIETTAFADVAYGASFADHDSYGQWGLRQTDKDGRLRWDVAVGPTVPDGIATVIATGHNPETGGGSGDGEFLVARQGGCR